MTCLRGLEEVVEPVIPDRCHVAAGLGHGPLDRVEVLFVPDLEILRAVESEDGASCGGERGTGVVGEREAKPGGVELEKERLGAAHIKRGAVLLTEQTGLMREFREFSCCGLDLPEVHGRPPTKNRGI